LARKKIIWRDIHHTRIAYVCTQPNARILAVLLNIY